MSESKDKNRDKEITVDAGERAKRRKIRKLAENTATFGMLTLLIALAVPIVSLGSPEFLAPWKWVYAAGALIYLVARCLKVNDPAESFRLRRLRRMQAWGGIAFAIAAGFWFYSESRLGATAGPLAILRQTILFSLVGAMLQIISSWMIYRQEKKENIPTR